MPSLSMLKLIGAGVAALILLAVFADRVRWMHRAHNAEGQVAAACTATREAAANLKLNCDRMPEQIRLLGKSIADLKAGIATQNAAVNALGAKSKADQAAAAGAVLKAATRAREAEATSERLRASTRAGGAVAGSQGQCKPSRAVEDAWR